MTLRDWGTTIVDAGGSFHDVAKNAFDSLAGGNTQPLNVTENLLRDTFSKTWSKFREKASDEFGIDLEDGLSLEKIGRQLAKGLGKNALEFTAEAAGGYLLSRVAGAEGPIGILLSEIVTIGISEFSRRYISTAYDTGQWVLIDMGMLPVRINQQPHVIQVSEDVSIWGDSFLDVPDDIDYQSTPHHAIGFILGPGDTHEFWTVFNFETGKEERTEAEKLRAAPGSLAEKLDANPEFSLVREVKFLKDHDPTLKSYVPTQPGDSVIYKKKHYTIYDTFDDEYILEGKDGTRVHVNVSQLSGGIQTNSSTWKRGNLIDNSFTSLSPDSVFSGQWLWIPAGKKFVQELETQVTRRRMAAAPAINPSDDILALVESIEGDQLHLVRAYDGKRLTEPLDVSRAVKAEVASVLNHTTESKRLKNEVLGGKNTTLHPLGESMHDVALGVGAPDLTSGEDMQPLMRLAKAGAREDSVVHQYPGGKNALNALARPVQEEIDDAARYDNTNRYQVVVNERKEVGTRTGGGTQIAFLVAGIVIFIAVYG